MVLIGIRWRNGNMLLKIKLAMKIIAMIPEIYKTVEPHVAASIAMRQAAEVMNKAADVQEELEAYDKHS